MKVPASIVAEFIGTFLLVLFGCGAVATSVVFQAPQGVFQVAIVWGMALSLAIYLVGPISGAHLNPAMTLAFVLWRKFPAGRAVGYIAAQFAGAFLAAAVIYLLFAGGIAAFEGAHGIERGAPGSEASAMIFGEYFPNPSGEALTLETRRLATPIQAFWGEFAGTALLAFFVFGLTSSRSEVSKSLVPVLIGAALTVLICLFAPLTMAGFNPARDLAPRVFSSLVGWEKIPFTTNETGWIVVYVVAPIVGRREEPCCRDACACK